MHVLQIADLLKRVEFVIIPVVNPDGYYVRGLAAPTVALVVLFVPTADMATVPQVSLLEEECGQDTQQS